MRAVGLNEKRAFLSRPETYGAGTTAVQVVETHMSLVFLTDGHAYKLKKPVRHPYLDFRTLAARAQDCQEELRLNRRLTRDVYLDVLPLVLAKDGALALDGRGEVVDWLVHMRRLAQARFLDQAILAGAVVASDVERVGAPLVAFYRAAPPVGIDPEKLVSRFLAEHRTSVAILKHFPLDSGWDAIDLIDDALLRFLDLSAALIHARVAERRIVEGHGDLRPEHVHLGPPVNIIDCLEFSRWLRLVDPFEEIAFLTMECERLGAKAFAEQLMSYCREALEGPPPPALVFFYKSFRALLRARLCLLHLAEPFPRDAEKWPKLAAVYLTLARDYAQMLGRP
jgi:aminoglycoside phosphotransferase family enzyme